MSEEQNKQNIGDNRRGNYNKSANSYGSSSQQSKTHLHKGHASTITGNMTKHKGHRKVLRLLTMGNIQYDEQSNTIMFKQDQLVIGLRADGFLHVDSSEDLKVIVKRLKGTFISGSLYFDIDFMQWRFTPNDVEPTQELHFETMLKFPTEWIENVRILKEAYTGSPEQLRGWCASLEQLFQTSRETYHIIAHNDQSGGNHLLFSAYAGLAGELRKLVLTHKEYGVTRIVVRSSLNSAYVAPAMEQVYNRLIL